MVNFSQLNKWNISLQTFPFIFHLSLLFPFHLFCQLLLKEAWEQVWGSLLRLLNIISVKTAWIQRLVVRDWEDLLFSVGKAFTLINSSLLCIFQFGEICAGWQRYQPPSWAIKTPFSSFRAPRTQVIHNLHQLLN